MKIYPDFSEITQIKMCLSSINHEDEQISPLYININITEECTQVNVLPECSMIIEVARN